MENLLDHPGLAFALVAGYFVPTLIAWLRGIRAREPLFWINLLLGWTGIVWFYCFCWSMLAAGGHTDATDATKACPRCAETIKAAATACRFCGTEFRPQAVPPTIPDSNSASGQRIDPRFK